MLKILEQNLTLRRLLARPITAIRNNELIKSNLKKLGLGADAWAASKAEEQYKELYLEYKVDFSKFLKSKQPVGLIALDDDEVNIHFVNACKDLSIPYEVFDPIDVHFVNKIKHSPIKRFLVRPSHKTQLIRQMFVEKIEMIVSELGKFVYPAIKEQRIYEAKRCLAYFLQANDIPHPQTWVFYDTKQALQFIETAKFPIVFKTHNGASACGVEILKSKSEAANAIRTCFNSYYINKVVSDYRDIDYGYVILQEFIEGAREHRIIKIGDSWMGHEKTSTKNCEFKSGSGSVLWTPPSNAILDFCRKIAETHKFQTMSFDIFEDRSGNFYVNELQTWFGSYNPSQMYINGVPGRLVYNNASYDFEPGLFNDNASISLRLIDMLNLEDKE